MTGNPVSQKTPIGKKRQQDLNPHVDQNSKCVCVYAY